MFSFIRKSCSSNISFLQVALKFTITTTITTAAAVPYSILCWVPLQIPDNRSISSKSTLDASTTTKEKKTVCSDAASENSQLVATVLKEYGLTDSQVAVMFAKNPRLRSSHPEKTIRPKMHYLCTNVGFSSNSLVKLVTSHPRIFHHSLENAWIPALDFLTSSLASKENVVYAIQRWVGLLQVRSIQLVPVNMNLLKQIGTPESSISKILLRQPRTLTMTSDHFAKCLNELKLFGIDPSSPMFVHALPVRATMSDDKWNSKIAIYRNFGWSDNEIFLSFKRWPYLLSMSQENIQRSLDFTMNKLKLSTAVLQLNLSLLTSSLEKRIIPRCCVLDILMAKGVVNRDNVVGSLRKSSSKFMKDYVNKYQSIYPEVLEAYRGKREFVGFDYVV